MVGPPNTPIRAGDSLSVVVKTITAGQLAAYADASGDRNPLHLDAEFAATTQFGGIIAHGMLTLAFVSEMLTRAFGMFWLEKGSLSVKFRGAAYLGDVVETWGQVSRSETRDGERLVFCAVGVRKQQDGQDIISGMAKVTLPAADMET